MEIPKKFHVAIGTKNPAKIRAVELGFKKMFPDFEYKATPVEVDSQVGIQPFGLESTIQGAINRAKNAFSKVFQKETETSQKNKTEIHIGAGIEAGMIPVPLTNTGYLDFQFCAIYQSSGSISIGSGPGFEYPKRVVKILFDDPSHNEIGTIIDFISGIENTKQNEGAIGLLTNNVFKRVDVLQYSVITALLPLKNPDLYSE